MRTELAALPAEVKQLQDMTAFPASPGSEVLLL